VGHPCFHRYGTAEAVPFHDSELRAVNFSRRGVQASAFALIGAEAQQGGNVSGAIKLGVVLHVEQFNVAADGGGNDGFGYIFDFAGLVAAGRALSHYMRVKVAAIHALYRQMREFIAD